MNGSEYQKELKRLDLTSPMCAEIFGYSVRTSQRWDKVGPPIAVAALMKLATDKMHLIILIDNAR